MRKRFGVSLLVTFLLCFLSLVVASQDIQTKGSIRGTITDPNGAVLPGATVTVTGPTGEQTATTDSAGRFEVSNLTPGAYTVKVTQSGFKTLSANATVYLGRTTTLDQALEVGATTTTVEVTATNTIDQQSTAIGSNLNDELFRNIPVARGVSGLFYLAPGAADSLGGGRDNPSISGGSGLDNLYVADGVNVTDSAFGGIGTFSRSYGPLGTGINTSFIKEVQVKTAGFEPQYGQSQGGIVNIVTQSGTNEYHGAVYGYMTPKQFEASRRQPDLAPRFNRYNQLLHNEVYDAGADFGGYVPHFREHLFFFGSFNPTVRRNLVRGAEANSLALFDSGLRTARGDEFALRTRTLNYAFKLDYQINPNHQITFSIFGDPSKTNNSSWRSFTPGASIATQNTTADSQLEFGTRNMSIRYNGTLSPTMTLNASLGFNRSNFSESGFADLNAITDRRGSDAPTIAAFLGCNDTSVCGPAVGNYIAQGLGFFEPTVSKTRRFDINFAKTQKFFGQHTFGIGYTYQRGTYAGTRDYSGPKYTIPDDPINGVAAGQEARVQFRLRYTTNPNNGVLYPVALQNGTTQLVPVRLQVIRAEFGPTNFDTFSNYHAAYAQDTWRVNKYITGIAGIRWEEERLTGTPFSNGDRFHYTFTGQWAPRVGFTVDPFGKGKTKAFYNYGRYYEYLPLDMAERSLSLEQDWLGSLFLPQYTTDAAGRRIAVINDRGTVNPVIDLAHQLSAPTISISDTNPITAGTKLGFTIEHTVGFEQELPWHLLLSARFIDRRAKRIIEDAASVSPEAALAGVGQVYFIGNISPSLDAAVNLVPFQFTPAVTSVIVNGHPTDFITNTPAGCASTPSGQPGIGPQPTYIYQPGAQAVCFAQTGIDPLTGNEINTPDGIPDGFPRAIRNYQAVEIELTKRFANNWQGFFNWRIAKLRGNFEGHLRNDNGQTDPGISSLFDFTTGQLNLLGDQFAVGPLNTDRKHVINMYGNYSFGKTSPWGNYLNGLNVGTNMHFESGIPINALNPHPVYLNVGEIPVGGRGSLGRTPSYFRVDAHVDYPWQITEKMRLKFIADFFNVFNKQTLLRPDENVALEFNSVLGTNIPNPDFQKPRQFRDPFNVRLGMRFEF